MKRERLVILLGILIALVFAYLGLNEWLKSRQAESPPPMVIKPQPKPKEETKTPEVKEEKPAEQEANKDLIAQKIKEEKAISQKEEPIAQKTKEESKQQARKEEPVANKKENEQKAQEKAKKSYVVQIGAFKDKENAKKALAKVEKMGYKAQIVEEDTYYKVRINIKTANINEELRRLRSTFGGAIVVK
ncbi:MAG: SPOR domain-containing protein [Aquificota bacterium]|nr:MAG: SPOR domain-containing protein [Aquificota bacterium]